VDTERKRERERQRERERERERREQCKPARCALYSRKMDAFFPFLSLTHTPSL